MDWISVLPGDYPEDLLAGVLRGVEERGWSGSASRGREQTVVTISGGEEASEVAAVLPAEVDLQPLLSRSDYARVARRRWLMAWLVRVLGVVVAVVGLVPVVGFIRPPDSAVSLPDQVLVGAVDDIPTDGSRLVRVDGRPVLVIRMEDGVLHALGATCSYTEECQLEWDPLRHQIICPCHGDVFDIFGNVLQGPSSIPLRRYAVEVVDGRIYLEAGA